MADNFRDAFSREDCEAIVLPSKTGRIGKRQLDLWEQTAGSCWKPEYRKRIFPLQISVQSATRINCFPIGRWEKSGEICAHSFRSKKNSSCKSNNHAETCDRIVKNDISRKTFQCIIFQDDHTRNVPSNMPDAKAVKGITLKGGVSYV